MFAICRTFATRRIGEASPGHHGEDMGCARSASLGPVPARLYSRASKAPQTHSQSHSSSGPLPQPGEKALPIDLVVGDDVGVDVGGHRQIPLADPLAYLSERDALHVPERDPSMAQVVW
jgi:hypothetical protein